jgi:ElaB/YqjD/DUF883 family membrane-anchored ribosome-binding protein
MDRDDFTGNDPFSSSEQGYSGSSSTPSESGFGQGSPGLSGSGDLSRSAGEFSGSGPYRDAGAPAPLDPSSSGSDWSDEAKGLGERMVGRVRDAAESGKSGVAGGIHSLGDRIEDMARPLEESGGVRGRVGGAIHRAGDTLEEGAEYLRTHELGVIRDDVTDQIRSHPFLSVGIALGTGMLLGAALGGSDSDRDDDRSDDRDDDRHERHDRHDQESASGLTGFLGSAVGRAITAGVTTLVASQVRNMVAGTSGSEDRLTERPL